MVGALSDDLRERVVSAVEDGENRRIVSIRFGVSSSSVNKWVSSDLAPLIIPVLYVSLLGDLDYETEQIYRRADYRGII